MLTNINQMWMKPFIIIVLVGIVVTSPTSAHEIGAKCNQTYENMELAYKQAERLRSTAINSIRLERLRDAIANLKRAADVAIKCWRGSNVQVESSHVEYWLHYMEEESPFLLELRK